MAYKIEYLFYNLDKVKHINDKIFLMKHETSETLLYNA